MAYLAHKVKNPVIKMELLTAKLWNAILQLNEDAINSLIDNYIANGDIDSDTTAQPIAAPRLYNTGFIEFFYDESPEAIQAEQELEVDENGWYIVDDETKYHYVDYLSTAQFQPTDTMVFDKDDLTVASKLRLYNFLLHTPNQEGFFKEGAYFWDVLKQIISNLEQKWVDFSNNPEVWEAVNERVLNDEMKVKIAGEFHNDFHSNMQTETWLWGSDRLLDPVNSPVPVLDIPEDPYRIVYGDTLTVNITNSNPTYMAPEWRTRKVMYKIIPEPDEGVDSTVWTYPETFEGATFNIALNQDVPYGTMMKFKLKYYAEDWEEVDTPFVEFSVKASAPVVDIMLDNYPPRTIILGEGIIEAHILNYDKLENLVVSGSDDTIATVTYDEAQTGLITITPVRNGGLNLVISAVNATKNLTIPISITFPPIVLVNVDTGEESVVGSTYRINVRGKMFETNTFAIKDKLKWEELGYTILWEDVPLPEEYKEISVEVDADLNITVHYKSVCFEKLKTFALGGVTLHFNDFRFDNYVQTQVEEPDVQYIIKKTDATALSSITTVTKQIYYTDVPKEVLYYIVPCGYWTDGVYDFDESPEYARVTFTMDKSQTVSNGIGGFAAKSKDYTKGVYYEVRYTNSTQK